MEIEGTHDFIAISIGKFDGCLVSFHPGRYQQTVVVSE